MGWVGSEILEDFVVVFFFHVCLFFSLLFCYFIDFLAVFHCREEFCEKSVSEDF